MLVVNTLRYTVHQSLGNNQRFLKILIHPEIDKDNNLGRLDPGKLAFFGSNGHLFHTQRFIGINPYKSC